MTPGSDAAIQNGCRCPIMDNARGQGYGGGAVKNADGSTCFVVMMDCPLHANGKWRATVDQGP